MQQYGGAVTPSGRPDCELGQRGYPRRLADFAPPEFDVVLNNRTPGAQGPTYEGRGHLPNGQTYDAYPDARTAVRP
jgi:hypothetical protein